MVQFRVDIDGTTFDELDNVTGESTINPFGDRFVVTFRDIKGDKFDSININSTAEIYAREPTPPNQANNTFDKIFEGYIVQADTRTEGGADILDITIYSFDQLIRNETVSNDQTDTQIDAILKDIIQTDTPVEYLSGNVAVQDNRKIRRSLQGVKVEEALRFLSRRSENEEYGVNASKEFFFRPREETSANTDITDNDAVDYNIPERGKEQKTEVTCFYDNGNEDITVTLGSEQLQAQEDFSTQDAVPFPDEINRPSVTNRQEALEIARNFARDREQTLAGQVIAVGSKSLVDADVGDSINVTLSTRGLDDEFTIVTKEVDYIRNEVAFGIVERRGDQDSLLKAIGQQVKRNELENADQSKPADVVEQTTVRVDITPTFDSLNASDFKLTTIGRNKLRDAWDDGSEPTLSVAEIGDGDSVSRANTSVPNVTETTVLSVNTTSNGFVSFDFDFNTGSGDIIGIKDVDDDLIFISKLDNSQSTPSDTISVDISDVSAGKSTFTTDGLNTIRDLLNSSNTASLTEQVEFGDGGSDPQPSDTSLDNVVDTVGFNSQILQFASQTNAFNDLILGERLFTDNNALKLAQSGFVEEAETIGGGNVTVSDSTYSNGQGVAFEGAGAADVNYTFQTNYEIPDGSAIIALRTENDSSVVVETKFDGASVNIARFTTALEWEFFNVSGAITAGSHTISIEHFSASIDPGETGAVLDLVGFIDGRYYDTATFDNTVNSNGYLSDPEIYPETESANLATISPTQSVKNAELSVSMVNGNTDNGQSLTIGNGTSTTTNNTTSVTHTFDASSETINGSITLDGYGTGGSQTPTERFNGQKIGTLTVTSDFNFLNPTEVGRADIEAFLTASEADGTTFQEVGQSNGSNLLTRSIFPEFTSDSQAVILSEDLGIDIS